MDNQLGFWALLVSAVTIGIGHSAAPDHWAPFAAVARSQKWSMGKTAVVSAVAGFGHVTVSALLGLVGLLLGLEMIQALGSRFEASVGYLLIAFGLAYALYGWRTCGRHRHAIGGFEFEHHHPHDHPEDLTPTVSSRRGGSRHPHEHRDITPLALFVLFTLDPCVAVVPIIFAAAALGALKVTLLVAAYEVATIGAIVLFSSLAYAGAARIRLRILETHGTVAAGLIIAAVGGFVQIAGI